MFGWLRKTMKYWLIFILLAFTITIYYGYGSYRKTQAKRNYAAIVNKKVITYEAWNDAFRNALSQYDSKVINSLDDKTIAIIKKRILDQLIDDELLYEYARKKVKVSSAEINSEYQKIKKSFPSDDDFKNFLYRQRLTINDIKNYIRRQLVIQKFVALLQEKQKVDEKEIKDVYEKGKDILFTQPERVHVMHILVKDEKKAEEIEKELKNGADFGELAEKESIDPSAKENKGDLGFVYRGQTVPEFEKQAFSMEPGEISPPIKTQYGYHIIKVLEKSPKTVKKFDEVKDEIELELKREKALEELDKIKKELREKAKIEINAVEYKQAEEYLKETPTPGPTESPEAKESSSPIPVTTSEPKETSTPSSLSKPENTPTEKSVEKSTEEVKPEITPTPVNVSEPKGEPSPSQTPTSMPDKSKTPDYTITVTPLSEPTVSKEEGEKSPVPTVTP